MLLFGPKQPYRGTINTTRKKKQTFFGCWFQVIGGGGVTVMSNARRCGVCVCARARARAQGVHNNTYGSQC